MAKYDYKKLAKQKKYSEKELNALKNHMNANPDQANSLNNMVANKQGTKLDNILEPEDIGFFPPEVETLALGNISSSLEFLSKVPINCPFSNIFSLINGAKPNSFARSLSNKEPLEVAEADLILSNKNGKAELYLIRFSLSITKAPCTFISASCDRNISLIKLCFL